MNKPFSALKILDRAAELGITISLAGKDQLQIEAIDPEALSEKVLARLKEYKQELIDFLLSLDNGPSCAICLDNALPDHFEGLMYCRKHHPAHQSEQLSPASPMSKEAFLAHAEAIARSLGIDTDAHPLRLEPTSHTLAAEVRVIERNTQIARTMKAFQCEPRCHALLLTSSKKGDFTYEQCARAAQSDGWCNEHTWKAEIMRMGAQLNYQELQIRHITIGFGWDGWLAYAEIASEKRLEVVKKASQKRLESSPQAGLCLTEHS